MSIRLEEFVRDNRDEFDSDEPSPRLWKDLQKDLRDGKRSDRVFHLSFLRWVSVAAIVVMMAGMFYYMDRRQQTDGAINVPVAKTDPLLDNVSPAYAKEVYHFTQLIELKQSELKQIEKEHPELYGQFVKDVHKLDSSYQSLRASLPANPDPEMLLEAMLQNLRLQADLLNQQLSIIKQIKQSKKGSHEKDTRTI
jgi:hypothetical protein